MGIYAEYLRCRVQLSRRPLRRAEVPCRSRARGSGADVRAVPVSRYHPLLLAPMPNIDPQKISVLLVHMSLGMLILGLTVIRLIVRLATAKPADATTGYAALDRAARLAHYAFYLLVVLMAGTGLATAILAGLNRSVFQKTGEALPASFDAYPTFTAHAYLALLLAGLIAVHVMAALYHQFGRGDQLLRRMWFGRRV